jgi:lipopolysaccharide transport system permease protein
VSNLLKFRFSFLFSFLHLLLLSRCSDKQTSGLLFPALIVVMGVLGLGLGMIISSLVTKYRDFSYLIGFGVQLLMYVSAVVYPMALVAAKCQSTFGWSSTIR